MKRSLFSILALVLCLSLCACGGEENPDTNNSSEPQQTENNNTASKILGKWEYAETNSTLEFNEDSTGVFTRDGTPLDITWIYDNASRTISITIIEEDITGSATYMEINNTILLEGWTFVKAEE